jgi:putative ATP-binding cassette transporter
MRGARDGNKCFICRLEVFLDHAPQDPDQPTIKTKVSDEIDFDDVTLQTPNYKRTLFKNMSFVLPKDQALLVVGKSGCGKSSLFRAIARY